MEKRISNFRYACKNYEIQKRWCGAYEKNQINESTDSLEMSRYRLIKSNIDYVERQFKTIEENHGALAKQLIWECFVEGCKQKELAEVYGIPLRTIQRRFHEWLSCIE